MAVCRQSGVAAKNVTNRVRLNRGSRFTHGGPPLSTHSVPRPFCRQKEERIISGRIVFVFLLVCSLEQRHASQTGWISDEACGVKHAKAGGADCVQKCWRGGASVVNEAAMAYFSTVPSVPERSSFGLWRHHSPRTSIDGDDEILNNRR